METFEKIDPVNANILIGIIAEHDEDHLEQAERLRGLRAGMLYARAMAEACSDVETLLEALSKSGYPVPTKVEPQHLGALAKVAGVCLMAAAPSDGFLPKMVERAHALTEVVILPDVMRDGEALAWLRIYAEYDPSGTEKDFSGTVDALLETL